MLVVARKVNEGLVLEIDGKVIEIQITDIGSQVRLGVSAPQDCKIWRKELYSTIQANRIAEEQDATPARLRSVAKLMPK